MTSLPRKAGAVLSLGRIYCDLVFRGLGGMPQLGRELFARDFAMTPGGGALITAAHLAAWAGLAPSVHESAGKAWSMGSRKGNKWLASALVEAAGSASRMKTNYLGARPR